MNDVIVLDHISKRFRQIAISKNSTIKDVILKGVLFRGKQPRRYVEAIKDISFSVPDATVLGLIGPNGAGKSTLLRILAGIYSPTSGQLTVNGRVSALLSLGLGFHPEFSGRENIMISGLALGLSHQQIKEMTDGVIQFAELDEFIDMPMRTYSSGMYMRLAFSVAVNVDPDILLIDEVLAVGDASFAQKSRARIEEFKKRGKTIILATHDLNTVETWCQKALLLYGGQMHAFGESLEVVSKYRELTAGRTT